jgi:serine/threonine protein kinase
MATTTKAPGPPSVVSAIDTNKLRSALRLVHCIQKERGSSCAYYADTNDVFRCAMLEARAASDSSVQLMTTTSSSMKGPDLPIGSSLRKIRNLIDESSARSKSTKDNNSNNKSNSKGGGNNSSTSSSSSINNSDSVIIGNPQDPSNELIFHRIFVCFNALISSIVHGYILHSELATTTNSITPNRKTTLKRRPRRELSTDIDDKLQSNPDFTGVENNDNNNYDGVPIIQSTERYRKTEPLATPNALGGGDGVTKSTTTTSNTSSIQQQLLTLLHLFVQLKESAGVERAVLSSLLAFRSHGTISTLPSLRMLINDLILEVENQRALYHQLQRLPSTQHHTLVLELAQLSPRLLDLQQIILSDFDSLDGLEYDSETIWDMITLYIDKLHSVELLIIEDLECSMPVGMAQQQQQQQQRQQSEDDDKGSMPPSSTVQAARDISTTSRDLLDTTLEQLVHDNFDTNALLEQIEGMSADSLKERVKELLRSNCNNKNNNNNNNNNNNKQVGVGTTQITTSRNVSFNQSSVISSPTSNDPAAGEDNHSGKDNNNKKYLLDKRSSKEWEISIYEINFTKRIGQGASATTYLGKWTNQNVAVKVASITEFGLEGWRTEVHALQRLHHPNIIRLMGSIYNENPQTHCLVLEYCNAGDLATALRYPTPRNFFFHVSSSIANAMAYLHKRGIMHRDLKPANILCDGNIASGNFVVKVTDFGIATDISRSKPISLPTDPPPSAALIAADEEAESTLTGETGTYRWMSPEVIRHESYSSMADVYSYAVMLWQFISHEEPFCLVGSIEAARLTAIEKERPPMPKQIPSVVAGIIRSNWDDDTNQRWEFSTIVERLQQLESQLSAEETAWLEEPYGHPVYTSETAGTTDDGDVSSVQLHQLPVATANAGRRREPKQSRRELKRRESSGRIASSHSPVRKQNLLSSFFGQRKKGSMDY